MLQFGLMVYTMIGTSNLAWVCKTILQNPAGLLIPSGYVCMGICRAFAGLQEGVSAQNG